MTNIDLLIYLLSYFIIGSIAYLIGEMKGYDKGCKYERDHLRKVHKHDKRGNRFSEEHENRDDVLEEEWSRSADWWKSM
jgi:hypothetical protein